MEEELEKDHPQVTMLDPFKIWKKLYFSTEEILTSTMRNYISTDEFANGIDIVLNSYLQYLKLQKESVNRYMEESPFSSKRDVARVAELVVSLENKVDGLEGEIETGLEEIGTRIDFITEELSQPAFVTAEDLSKALAPAIADLKILGKKVNDLEKLMKKIDSNLSATNKLIKAAAKPKTPAAKNRIPGPSTELPE